jgi:hypothetical protein
MSAHLADEQRAFIETARRIAPERLAPRYQARENDGRIERELMRHGLARPDRRRPAGGLRRP